MQGWDNIFISMLQKINKLGTTYFVSFLKYCIINQNLIYSHDEFILAQVIVIKKLYKKLLFLANLFKGL
jgi:hypothetical protein